ncbi:MAG TPA: serine hydrolase [Longimicrobium sp.]|nr:serine hydrolase [Longimicrobium sp.]
MKLLLSACVVALSILVTATGARGQAASAPDLAGLWYAKGRFGPDVAGRLIVDRPAGEWRASIAGRMAAVRVANDSVSFDLPDGSGAFIGRMDARRGRITGHWIQPRLVTEGWRSASPVVLEGCGAGCFAGTVAPRADEFTFWLQAAPRPDGTLGVLLRNPERNLARFIRADRMEADSAGVRLLNAQGAPVVHGLVREDEISLYIPGRGGSYDFRRVPDGAFTWFYPRGRPTTSYRYVPPADRGDGWPVGSLEDVGISRERISELVETLVSAPVDSLGALKVHGLLIARHGRLVLEEYFYGEHGDKPHETRSASKTVATVLIGAAMQAGMEIGPETPVYAVMRPGARDLDARKRALTIDHLLTMSSGFDCDDNGDERPGNEDAITQQDQNPDWYGMILDLDMIRDPGAQSVYCSINPHLAGGVLSRATGRSLPDLMYELVAEPLGMRDYHIPLTPLGDGYLGGGWKFRPRDFMKLGQLYLNGGTWQGRRVLSEEWVRHSTADRYPMGRRARYGYLWWLLEYPYAGRTVKAYFASGNGGQEVMVVPELDLVIAVYGGNYNEAAGWLMVTDLIPRYILPAVNAEQ